MPRNVPVFDAPLVMADDDLDVECAQGHGLNGEEVRRPDLGRVIAKKRAPDLRREAFSRRVPVAPYRPDADVEPERLQLADETGRAPAGILLCQLSDQGPEVPADPRASRAPPATAPGPVAPPTGAAPTDDRLWLHEDQRPAPARPAPDQEGPEEPIAQAQRGPTRLPLVDGELLAQRQVLPQQVPAASPGPPQRVSQQAEREQDGGSSRLQMVADPFSSQRGWSFAPPPPG